MNFSTHQARLFKTHTRPSVQPSGRIAAKTAPAEEQVGADLLASDKRSEDDEDGGACIVRELQDDDLGEDAGRRQICERSRAEEGDGGEASAGG